MIDRTDAALLLVGIALGSIGLAVAVRPIAVSQRIRLSMVAHNESTSLFSPASLDTAAKSLVDNDPFDQSRLPTTAHTVVVSQAAPNAARVRPVLTLRGIVGGPPWRAIVDGLPGALPATVVQVGDTVGGLVVRAIGTGLVTIVSKDTAWKLTLARH